MEEPRPTTISARPRDSRSSVANSWNARTGSSALSTVTALVRRMRCVRAAAAPRITAGAESRNSRRWCSPIPNASSPTSSACSICWTSCRRRSAGFTARLFSSKAAAKLSIPTCIVCASEEDRSVPDKGAHPEEHDRDEGIDLQRIVRQLRRDGPSKVAGRENEPELHRRWKNEQRCERDFHHAEQPEVPSNSEQRHSFHDRGIARQLQHTG